MVAQMKIAEPTIVNGLNVELFQSLEVTFVALSASGEWPCHSFHLA